MGLDLSMDMGVGVGVGRGRVRVRVRVRVCACVCAWAWAWVWAWAWAWACVRVRARGRVRVARPAVAMWPDSTPRPASAHVNMRIPASLKIGNLASENLIGQSGPLQYILEPFGAQGGQWLFWTSKDASVRTLDCMS